MAKLEGQLELGAVVAISISSMVGSGIFVLPGLAAGHAGPSVWLAYLVAGLCVLPAALSKAELAAAMPSSGGTYVYLNRTFGPLVGTIAGLGLWVSLLLKGSFALIGIGVYLDVLVDVPVIGFALFLVLAIVVVNIVGVQGVSRIQKLLTTVSLVGLVLLTGRGLFYLDTALVQRPMPEGATGFAYAVGFVFVSYAGVTKVAAIAEEVKDPERNIPRGILLSLGIVMLVYAGVTFVLVGVVPFEALAGDVRPVHTLAARIFAGPVASAFAGVAVLTLASMANAGLLSASRFPFAMSRDRLMPSILQTISVRAGTPINAVLLSGGLMAAVIVTMDVEKIAKAASTFMIIMFMAVCVSVIVLRESNARWYRPAFSSPLYPYMQIFGVLSGAVLLVVLGPFAALAGLLLAAPGVLLFFVYGRRRAHHQGVLSLRGRRQDLVRPQSSQANLPLPEDADVPERAEVVCALFGTERSPEMVVELGAALAAGAPLEVVYVTEVPEQSLLEAIGEEEPRVVSVRRRAQALAEARGIPLDFETVRSHDVAHSIAEISGHLHCDWLVIEHGGRTARGVTFGGPLGWLKDHVAANLAVFRDAGVRYIREILVFPNRGAHDSLVAVTADHLAEVHGASLTFVATLPEGAPPRVREEAEAYLEQMRRLCTCESRPLIVEAKIQEQTITRLSAGYDLLVMGESASRSMWSTLRGTMAERITETAGCSVLRVQSARHHTHEAFARRMLAEAPKDGLLSMLTPGCIDGEVPPMNKDALFNHFARVFSTALPGTDAKEIAAQLWVRERELNTALGDGIAVPHATLSGLEGTYLGVFVTTSPVDYAAPDGRAVDVYFVTLGGASDRHGHLTVLSAVSRLLRDSDLAAALRSAKDPDRLLEALASPPPRPQVA